MMGLVYGGIIYLVVLVSMELVQHFDTTLLSISPKEKMLVWVCSVSNGMLLVYIVRMRCMSGSNAVLLAVFAGCLIFSCLTDVRTCYVYQFVWWLAGGAGAILLGLNIQQASILSLLAYVLLQEFFFYRFYGRADCHAFSASAVILCALGMGMMEYWTHMLLAFLCLGVVQMFAGNVDSKGRLKRAVAFLPYIMLGFWVLLFL